MFEVNFQVALIAIMLLEIFDTSAAKLRKISIKAVSMTCDTHNLEIRSELQFAKGVDKVNCEDWDMALEVNGTTRSKTNICSICKAESKLAGLLLHNQILDDGSHRRFCSITTKLATSAQIGVTLKIEDQDKQQMFVEFAVQIPCTMLTDLAEIPAPESHWTFKDDFWDECFWSCYPKIIKSAMRLNMKITLDLTPEIRPLLMLPVFVMNLPSQVARRAHITTLLPAVGFGRLIFPEVRAAADIDIEALVSQGRLSREAVRKISERPDKGARAVRAYAAHALTVLETLRAAVDAGLEWFMIAEDDLMLADGLKEVGPCIFFGSDTLCSVGLREHRMPIRTQTETGSASC